MPDRVRPEPVVEVERLGPELLAATRREWAGRQPPPCDAVGVCVNLPYGDDPRHRLDVFAHRGAASTAGAAGRPVLVFVHGGGFVAGDKQTAGTPFFRNVGEWAARNGMLGVNMTYRLAPLHRWPSGSEDVAAAVRWVREHASRFGGDAARIVLLGHSAGAAHVAGFLAGAGVQSMNPRIAGAVLVSGIYDPPSMPPAPWLDAYYGAAPPAATSTLAGLSKAAVPIAIIVAERDPSEFRAQGQRLLDTMTGQGAQAPAWLSLDGHNHYSTILHLNAQPSALADCILRMADREAAA